MRDNGGDGLSKYAVCGIILTIIDAAMRYRDSILVGRVVPNAPRRLGDKPPYHRRHYLIAEAIRANKEKILKSKRNLSSRDMKEKEKAIDEL